MNWKLRDAETGDADRLAQFAEGVFRSAFGPANTGTDMDLYCAAAFGPEIQAREMADPAIETILAEREGKLLGYAQILLNSDPPGAVANAPCELRRIYVCPTSQGSGLGQQLLDAVIGRARQRRADLLWLGVWEHNPRAIRFYRNNGFRQTGHQEFRLGTDHQRDLILVRSLVRTPARHGSTAS